MFSRAITAIITPFKNDKVDIDGLQKLVDWQYAQGIRSIAFLGSTGEASCLNDQEKAAVSTAAIECRRTHKDLQVILGINSISTDHAIKSAQSAEKLEADAILVSCPSYVIPNQKGLYHHFKSINDHTNIPIIVYNVPSRTSVDINNETIAKLATLNNIKGLKDATGDLSRPMRLAALLDKNCEFYLLSGEDITSTAFNAIGGVGCISVASNVAPHLVQEVQNATIAGDFSKAFELQTRLVNLYLVLFCERNPIPVKYAAYLLGKTASPKARSPLTELEESSKRIIEEALRQLELL